MIAIDRAPAGDDAVTRYLLLFHAEIMAIMFDKHIELFEGTFVEQQFDALSRGKLAFGVLGIDALLATTGPRFLPPLFKPTKNILHAAPSISRTGRSTGNGQKITGLDTGARAARSSPLALPRRAKATSIAPKLRFCQWLGPFLPARKAHPPEASGNAALG